MKRKLEKIKNSWYVWLFPVIALVISGWLVFDFYNQQGPTIKILFDDAAGIQAEKTKVRFRGVPIGTVKDVYISEDQKDVVAEVLLRRDARHFAVDGSKFSLVTPKVNFQGITGLETIFEGTYIAVLPGKPDADAKNEFKAQSSTTATDPLDDTSFYYIETANVENINPGDSVTYRGMKIGTVTKLVLSKDSRAIHIQINVENRYVKVIRTNTAFWKKVGVQAKLGLFKSEIKVNSLDSIMNGGIELATPSPAGAMAKAGDKFQLYPAAPKDYDKWNTPLEYQ
jgi:paraquat-inducible protein B